MVNNRESNVELLRIFSAIGVLILHINNPRGIEIVLDENQLFGGGNCLILNVFEFFFDPAVDIFILITGYFSCKNTEVKSFKLFSLYFQLFLLKLAALCFNIYIQNDALSMDSFLDLILPQKYFVSLYLVLIVISPYINKLLNMLSKKEFTNLMVVLSVCFSFIPFVLDVITEIFGFNTGPSNPFGAFGSQCGQTITSFILMYVVGAYIRFYVADSYAKKCRIGLILVMFLIFVVQFPMIIWECKNHIPITSRSFLAYHNPLVIVQAVITFLLFKSIDIRSKLINSLSTAAFTCYIGSTFIQGRLFDYNRLLVPPINMIGYLFFDILLVYSICWCYNFLYSKFVNPIINCVVHARK